ncbi:MAG: DUF3782 domain-containing protein [Magnetococcales bacterium]|nr:DUF3782 domain-containing protein [Magnetococcales bacterium]
MSGVLTIDALWKLCAENSRQLHEQSVATDRMLRDMRAEIAAADRRMRDHGAELEHRLYDMLREQRAETARMPGGMRAQAGESGPVLPAGAMDREFQETRRVIAEVSNQIDTLFVGQRGLFMEKLVVPGCDTLFSAWGIPGSQIYQRCKFWSDDGRSLWIDIMVMNHNSDAVVLVNVSSTLTVEEVTEYVERLGQFKEIRPRYAACRVLGAVAGIVTEEDATSYAANQGLFVIVQSGESVALANAPDFEPRVW